MCDSPAGAPTEPWYDTNSTAPKLPSSPCIMYSGLWLPEM